MNRLKPPNRRRGETIDIAVGEEPHVARYSVMIGRDATSGRLIEAFISSGKPGSALEAAARDAAVLISLALQYGAPLDELRAAVTRGDKGEPSSVIGAALDAAESVR